MMMMKDKHGHDSEVNVYDHPFLTGWKCVNCGMKTYTQDGLIPAEEPQSTKPCAINRR